MQPDKPDSYEKRVLVMVSGMNPQIITETIYALTQHRTPAFVPTRLVVLTTSEGADRVRLTLKGNDTGWLAQLCRDYDLPEIKFDAEDICVLRDPSGQPLADIRTSEENEAAADQIVDAIRELTSDDGSALHVSLAGGRKTMGYFVGYALSLYGRMQDRLSHVLVTPEFEQNRDFFYRTPYQRVIYDKKGKPLDASKAEVSLADIPFVRMREGLPQSLRIGRVRYVEAVAALQGRLGPPHLQLDVATKTVHVGANSFVLDSLLFAFYLWMAKSHTSDHAPVNVDANASPQGVPVEQTREFLDIYGRYVDVRERDALISMQKSGMDSTYFRSVRSKLNRALVRHIDDPIPERYIVQNFGKRRAAVYGLELPASAITIVEAVPNA